MKRLLLLLSFLSLGCGEDQSSKVPLAAPTPNAPQALEGPKQMLVIGDSISIGYTPYLKLKGYDIAHTWDHLGGHGNADATPFGLNMIDEWLAEKDWDLVTFNWGIHDFGLQNGVGPNANTSLEDYQANLKALATKIKAKSKRCVFITTTDIPDLVPTASTEAYREVALKIMSDLQIPVIDILALSHDLRAEHLEADLQTNEHFTNRGYEDLGVFISFQLEGL